MKEKVKGFLSLSFLSLASVIGGYVFVAGRGEVKGGRIGKGDAKTAQLCRRLLPAHRTASFSTPDENHTNERRESEKKG